MENKLLNSDQVKYLCELFDIDLSVLKEDVLESDWDEDCFLVDKCDFFWKCVCVYWSKREFVEKNSIYRKNMFSVDAFPKVIPIEGRFPQLEIFYRDDDKYGMNHLYFEEEKKHLSVLSKLWPYSSILVESNVHYDPALPDTIIRTEQFQSLKKIFEEKPLITIEEWVLLKYLFALGLKNYISICIYFIDLKVIVWLGSLRMNLYISNKEQEDFVRNICTTEGLYLY